MFFKYFANTAFAFTFTPSGAANSPRRSSRALVGPSLADLESLGVRVRPQHHRVRLAPQAMAFQLPARERRLHDLIFSSRKSIALVVFLISTIELNYRDTTSPSPEEQSTLDELFYLRSLVLPTPRSELARSRMTVGLVAKRSIYPLLLTSLVHRDRIYGYSPL